MLRYTDQTIMSFGKHQGTPLGKIPASYFLALKAYTTLSAPMKLYIEENFERFKAEARRSNSFNAR
jgi:hypothetical protein